jgi:hypothetical protein
MLTVKGLLLKYQHPLKLSWRELILEEFPSQPPSLLNHPPKNYQFLKVLKKF